MGVALWLMPKPGTPLYEALKSNIESLKPLFDDGHSFPPHVTITTDIHASSQTQVDTILDTALAACRSVPHVTVQVTALTYGSRFFKKVYFSVNPSAELVSLARVCREEFVSAPALMAQERNYSALSQDDKDAIAAEAARQASIWTAEYDPHISLVYSDAYPVDEAIRGTIHTRLADVFGPDYSTKGIGWTNGRIALVRCEGPVESWPIIGYRDL